MKNDKILMNEIRDLNKWKDIPNSCIGRIYILKMSVLLTDVQV